MTQPKAINVPRRSDIPGRATPGPAHGFFTKHESRNTAFFRPGLRSMKIMVRDMSLIRGLGAPAKEMSFRHLLALFKDHSCLLLPTISRHCPLLPAKKMSQDVVASQYGRGSRGPGRVPRAAPRQPGCTVEPTNHEPGPFLARGASRREFRGFHESRPFIVCFGRGVVRHAGWCPRAARTAAHASRSLLSCALWCGMARLWRGMGGILPPAPVPARRPPFSLSLTTHAVRWESRQSVQNPASPRKMRQAQRSLQFPSQSGPLPLWRTQHEPIPRKENVLYGVDTLSAALCACPRKQLG